MAAMKTRRARLRALSLAAVAAPLLLAGCGVGGPAHRAAEPAAGVSIVELQLTSFAPETVTIEVGDAVEWRNTSPIAHTVTADPARAQNPDLVRLPDGAEPFHSGEIPAGEIYRRTFDVPGEYVYFCIPHEQAGMRGRVIVRETAGAAG